MTSCPDCPDLAADRMPADWKPRAKCCRDEHIERRLAGSNVPWEGVERARAISDEVEARKNRKQRRAEAARKGKR